MSFTEHARQILPELIALRRDLHGHPELGLHLPRTQQAVLDVLDGLGLEITTGRALSSVGAVLRGAGPGPTVLLRADMDGLPITEHTDLEYASTDGTMHACGHDLHTAGLVGAARLLSARRNELAGNVIFMFQPGEEGPGGARPMIDEGVLELTGEKPVAAYAIHVCPGERGVFHLRAGTMMAGANKLRVTFHGKGGHGSRPHLATDPVPAVAEYVSALNTMITRRFSVFDPVVCTITQLEAGAAFNVIPDSASLAGSVRTLSPETTELFPRLARELADGVAASHGLSAEVDWTVFYPVTVNDDAEATFTASTLRNTFGEHRLAEAADPHMGSEDFSLVLQEVPGCFVFLRCSPGHVDPATAGWNHSADVEYDDAVLADQATALATLAFERLEQEREARAHVAPGS